MPGWTLIDSHPTRGCAFQRPLDDAEHMFFFIGQTRNGRTDFLRYLELRLLNGARDAQLFSEENVARAWVSTKKRFPLAGAVVQRKKKDLAAGMDWDPHFVVRECDLSVLRPREIVFGHVADAAEVQRQATAILDGPRPLSDDLLVQLYVFRETNSDTARQDILHVMVLTAHCVADLAGGRTLVRCFLDSLARSSGPESEIAQMPLEDRLAMAVTLAEREPVHLRNLSPARRQWRRAIAAVIIRLRFARKEESHTLPYRRTRSTPYTAKCSGTVETSLTQAQTIDVITKCHQLKITFGNAHLVLAQVAMTRVLYRRYLRGEISEEEWAYRKRQPYINQGPISLRPYLNKAWFEGGGGGEFVLSMSGYNYKLPFMTLGKSVGGQHNVKQAFSDDAPPFSDLLTFDRFLHRAGLIKKQAAALINHPLFFEIILATFQMFLPYLRFSISQQMKALESSNRNGNSDEDKAPVVMGNPVSLTHEGSNVGDMDLIFPLEYPLPPTHTLSPYAATSHPLRAGYSTPLFSAPLAPEADTTPTIAVDCDRSHLHVSPGQLFLGSETSRGQLRMYVLYDQNAFEEGVVKEWLDDMREAALWYLGNAACRQLRTRL